MKILTFTEWCAMYMPVTMTDEVKQDLKAMHGIDPEKEIDTVRLREYNDYLIKNSALKIRTFDIDGVCFINKDIKGLRPDDGDVIITGRSYEERDETEAMLAKRGITNKVMFNDLPFDEKTRESSGEHKANCIKALFSAGYVVTAHFEDDEIAIAIINRECPDVPVIHIVHNLSNKENQRHYVHDE
jgi:hypothetical protein